MGNKMVQGGAGWIESSSATTSQAGEMSAADKRKLDALSSTNDAGVIAVALFAMSVAPTVGDTIDIGANGYDIVAALIAPYGRTQIVRTATVNTQRNRIAHAFSGVVDANVTYAIGFVAPNINASNNTGLARVEIFNADAPQGNLVPGTINLALSNVAVAGSTVWDRTNFNQTGNAALQRQDSKGTFTVSATNVAFGFVEVVLPFVAVGVLWQSLTAAGLPVNPTTTNVFTFTAGVSTTSLFWTVSPGDPTGFVAGDVITWEAWSA